MRVIRLAWLGIPASNYTAMASFLRDTMGLQVEFDEPATTELSLPNDDRLQVFAPGHPYFAFFGNHARAWCLSSTSTTRNRPPPS